jgi:UDP-N-acetyl-alpha-D-muramoyl-L-alanyl-L-glutamate epimerase
MISYWKAACSPLIRIKKRTITEAQVAWWKDLYFKGLGEFFFLNSITISKEDFVEIECDPGKPDEPFNLMLKDSAIIPLGGGKDSVVTFELLSAIDGNIPLILNPREASMGTAKVKGYYYDAMIEVKRSIDPVLLELNEIGFLNGHTPFSALLAFITVLSAIMSGKKFIALSNESSANESTVEGTTINHQYSKTVEFERYFRDYIRTYISPDVVYFSFLRPLNELQIAGLFADYPKYFSVFKSCNAGSKTDTWCGKCPKCLFTYIILSPFIEHETLKKIFGRNLLEDETLLPILLELTGMTEVKPFDCIGTIDEVNVALCASIRKHPAGPLPYLLEWYKESQSFKEYEGFSIDQLLNGYDYDHFLPEKFEKILKAALHA